MELRVTLSKLHFLYDFELVDDTLGWHADSRMNTLWNKPKLDVKVVKRRQDS